MPGTAAPQGVSACSPLEAALQLASWGWPVFPLHEVHAEGACSCKKGKRCGKQAGKHPRVDGWQQQATTDPNTIRAWWRQWPHANVGVPTGPRSGLWVVGPDGPKGHAALADLERRHGVLPATPSSQTGSGGEHRFFRWPSGLTIANARNHRGVPIDIRGEGGLVVAPGSTNINGPYRWQAGLSPADVALADAPDWLLEWANAEPLLESDNGDAPEPESRAVWRLTATAGATPQERARAYLERCPPAVSGQGGHATTFRIARAVVWGFNLGAEEGYRLLLEHYNPCCRPPWSEKELLHKCQDADTRSCDKPRGWLLTAGRASVPAATPAQREPARPKVAYRPLPGYEPFPVHLLPPPVGPFVQASAEAIGCDPALVALPALAVLASCIGNSRALVLKHGWIEPCVLWTLPVAPSGELKTPAFRAATDALDDLQHEADTTAGQEKERYDEDLRAWQDADRDTRGPRPEKPPDAPIYFTSDATIEALGEILSHNPRGTLLMRDELDAWFRSFTRYKQGNNSDRPQWLELHGARSLTIDRLTREPRRVRVRRAAVCLTGTIQPAVLQEALDEAALQSGLGARFLLAMPPRRKKQWTEAEVAEDLESCWVELLRALLGLRLADEGKRKPHYLGLAGPAKRAWVRWYDEWAEEQFASEGAQASAWAKLEAYSARLALLHHVITSVASGAMSAIGEESVRSAAALTRWFAGETRRIYLMLGESREEAQTRQLVEFIRERGGRTTVRELQKSNGKKWRSSQEAEEALNALVQSGLATWREGKAPPGGGHRPHWLVLCPTPDTSDTRPGHEDGAGEGGADTRPDTRPRIRADGVRFPAFGDRVSEVSDVGQKTGSGAEEPTAGPGPGASAGSSVGRDGERDDQPPKPDEVAERAAIEWEGCLSTVDVAESGRSRRDDSPRAGST